MAKTYDDLLTALLRIPEERRNDHISVLKDGEFFEVARIDTVKENDPKVDQLDAGHLYLHILH